MPGAPIRRGYQSVQGRSSNVSTTGVLPAIERIKFKREKCRCHEHFRYVKKVSGSSGVSTGDLSFDLDSAPSPRAGFYAVHVTVMTGTDTSGEMARVSLNPDTESVTLHGPALDWRPVDVSAGYITFTAWAYMPKGSKVNASASITGTGEHVITIDVSIIYLYYWRLEGEDPE